MILKMQIVRKGTPYESYRISIPKTMVEHYDLADCKFMVEWKNGNLILKPIKEKQKNNKKVGAMGKMNERPTTTKRS